MTNRHRISRVTLLLISLFFITACAFGRKIEYQGHAEIQVPQAFPQKVLLIVHDQRPYVARGEKPESFVGIQRAYFGNPYGVRTKSGQPFAHDVAETLANSFRSYGHLVSIAPIRPGQDLADIEIDREKISNGVGLYIKISEWKTDTYFKTDLRYRVQLVVFDSKGAEITYHGVSGHDVLGQGNAERANLAAAVNSIFSELLNADAVVSAVSYGV